MKVDKYVLTCFCIRFQAHFENSINLCTITNQVGQFVKQFVCVFQYPMELSILAVMQNLYQNGAINSQLLVHHHSKFRNFTRIKENNAIGGGGSTAKTVLKDTPAKFQASLCKMQNMPQVGGSLKKPQNCLHCKSNNTRGHHHKKLRIWPSLEICKTPVENRNIVTITVMQW